MIRPVSGFSKKTKQEKIKWLLKSYMDNDPVAEKTLYTYWNSDEKLQRLHDDFTENTISNYYLPFCIAPNFLINQELYALPMVTEESSVVAAASNAAKFWLKRGGFKTEVVGTKKSGQVHFNYTGETYLLEAYFSIIKPELIKSIAAIEANMKKRGGGLLDISLEDHTAELEDYFLLHCTFETRDAMGANFINSCLEQIAKTFETSALKHVDFRKENTYPDVVLSILSNYVPGCLVKAEVSCTIAELTHDNTDGEEFATDFIRAVEIALVEPRRAVTHNKGAMNGVDAVVMATGNDFRAVEAGVHAYASKSGQYRSLTRATIEDGLFRFTIELPLALGTVGGLTSLHPMVKFALNLLQDPSAEDLMQIVAVAGLAQNFAAIRSLVTTGIQKGHMKMHLMNILNQLETTADEKVQAVAHFNDRVISHAAVAAFVEKLRN